MTLKICVFVGSNNSHDSQYHKATQLLGQEIASRGHTLIYGGANVGLMGTLADSALKAGGQVEGIIPKLFATQKIMHKKITKLHVVDSMQERKAKMAHLSNAFIVLPGGLGTLEEAFEVWNAVKIGLYAKPLFFLNVNGCYDMLFEFLNHANEKGFLKQEQLDLSMVFDNPSFLLNCIERSLCLTMF